MDKTTFAYRLHFENEPAEDLAHSIAARMPKGLERIFFVSGGSEAVESCIKLARQWAVATKQPNRWKVIGRMPSYHGGTFGSLSVTGDGMLTDDPLKTFGSRAVAEIPDLQLLMQYICRNGFEHHVAINKGHMAAILAEAFGTYFGFDVYHHETGW